jgi:hypothetical protein
MLTNLPRASVLSGGGRSRSWEMAWFVRSRLAGRDSALSAGCALRLTGRRSIGATEASEHTRLRAALISEIDMSAKCCLSQMLPDYGAAC